MKRNSFSELLQRLPVSLHSRALRYQSPLSAYNYVVGRLLLEHGLDAFGLDTDLEKIEFQENGKPYLSDIHFNISHSDHQVVCALANDGQIGVDVEKSKPINFEDFTSMFSTIEWTTIKGSEDPIRSFYWFWTRKEAIIKALGLTLSDLHQIELDVSRDHFVVDGRRWFLQEALIEEGYIGAICCEKEIGEVTIAQVYFDN